MISQLIAAYSFAQPASLAADPEPPNIVYILADDLGYGDVSCYNENSKLNTQHIDELAAQGIRFTDAHSGSAVCTPTRYGILTGRNSWRTSLKSGVLSGYSKALIEPTRMTVGKLLQKSGYHTAFIGKWHLGWDWHVTAPDNWQSGSLGKVKNPEVDFSLPIKNGPNDHGFHYSYGFSGSLDMPPYVYVENGVATTIPSEVTVSVEDKGFWRRGLTAPGFNHANVLPDLTTKAIRYLNARKESGQPFFLYFALPAPHTPILPSAEFLGQSNTNFYGDFVLQVDDVVGKITNALEKNGLGENTIVIFTSDNGCSPKANFKELSSVGHHPNYIFRGHKADIYEGGHRVPFIVRWPNMAVPASLSDEVISTTDFMATVADILHVTLPDNAAEDSFSVLPVLKSDSNKRPIREAIVHHSAKGRFAIRKGAWKLILWPGSGGWSYPETKDEMAGLPAFQLYNLEMDPSEKTNLANTYPEKVNELKNLLVGYIELGRSTPGTPQENEGMDNWPQLDWITNTKK